MRFLYSFVKAFPIGALSWWKWSLLCTVRFSKYAHLFMTMPLQVDTVSTIKLYMVMHGNIDTKVFLFIMAPHHWNLKDYGPFESKRMFCQSLCSPSRSEDPPPRLDVKTGWTGELWSKNNLIKYRTKNWRRRLVIVFFSDSFSKYMFLTSMFFKYFFFYIFVENLIFFRGCW